MTTPADTATRIRRATIQDTATVTSILAAAFQDGDLAPWLIPDELLRRRTYPRYFAMLAEHAIEHGHVDVIGDRAAAFWYNVGAEPTSTIDDYDQRLAAITGPALHRFQALDEAMHTHHPRDPHTYLAFLAVIPDRQSQGHGSALLSHRHAELDRQRCSSYLEATGAKNSALYARHGYQPLGPYPITADGPNLHPMWRAFITTT
ncbi:GNAT family N-acetyltransferase [Actinoplanes regularis]|uniref:Acetyltransferase (GNAT) domain-containing protein n=1 Tax=Actinoplanes regularis TaxID=52697 RepID=A0A238XG96_9ACTN|nr:GNAT family N-acetyltransferase [Actinoplanes regularis]GIE86806.1 GCN5 family N-acetyltransferase [Actinoplanes regularis]SNR58025.1 Acetyltransferase (GNAT) domain-containing protein [Actinoplanes regularis]